MTRLARMPAQARIGRVISATVINRAFTGSGYRHPDVLPAVMPDIGPDVGRDHERRPLDDL